MTRRIVVTGSECTGKTTLARTLALELHAPWVPEAARSYAEERLREGRALGPGDVEPIARCAIAAQDAAQRLEPRELVLDTDLVSTVAYARHYYGSCPSWIETEARSRLGVLYLLCAPDLPWTADGVRDQPDARHLVHEIFRRVLDELGASVSEVSGLGGARWTSAMGAITKHRIATPGN